MENRPKVLPDVQAMYKRIQEAEDIPPEQIREYLQTILFFMGEDPTREGLLGTPDRMIKSWDELYAGYQQTPAEILKTIFSETDGYDQIVLLRDIPFFSNCEHHNLPFYGKAHVGYVVSDKVVGISKLARLLDCFARRMQIQERLTKNTAQAIMAHLNPFGCGVVVIGQHLCMTARGVKKSGSTMVTSAMEGIFKKNIDGIKDEFFQMIKL